MLKSSHGEFSDRDVIPGSFFCLRGKNHRWNYFFSNRADQQTARKFEKDATGSWRSNVNLHNKEM